MNRRKQNISRWYALGLAAVLMVACVVMAAGTAWARYRLVYDFELQFEAKPSAAIRLGMMDDTTGVFDSTVTGCWEQTEQGMELAFAVANGTDAAHFEEDDQRFRIRLVSTLGLDAEKAAICLRDPLIHTEPEDAGYAAQASPITPDSPLHRSFGDGWVYSFVDEQGQELVWTLEGGVFSCAALHLTLIPTEQTTIDPSLVQIQILGEQIDS